MSKTTAAMAARQAMEKVDEKAPIPTIDEKSVSDLSISPRKMLPFMRILRYGQSYGFSYSDMKFYTPSKEETVAHLKLLRAFAVLKKTIVANVMNSDRRNKLWQSYLTMATRRYVIFMDAVMRYNEKERPTADAFKEKLSQFLPPIDVILIWHSFLLNTKSYSSHMNTHKLSNFMSYGFPLEAIQVSISNHTFKFNPIEPHWIGFNSFILQYGGTSELFRYNSYELFDPAGVDLDVNCPNCGHTLIHVPLINDDFRNGFCDPEFEFKLSTDKSAANCNCECGFLDVISHGELRKRQLWSDISKGRLPYFQVPLYASKEQAEEKAEYEDAVQTLKNNQHFIVNSPLEQFLFVLREEVSSKAFLALRPYVYSNLIHATVKNSKFVLNDDLVACVFRQERFISKMEEIRWLDSLDLDNTILEAIERYLNFVGMFKGYVNFPIVPTLDIDLVWHTHQLNPGRYHEYCRFRISKILHHDDKVEENRLDRGFEKTCAKYKQYYKKDYSICFCSYCSYQRTKQRGIFRKKKSVDPSMVKSNVLNLGHISCHDSVHIPTERVKKMETRLKHFYLKTYNNYLPWQERDVDGYIKSPLYPIEEIRSYNFPLCLHENGMCYGVNDPESACMGLSGNGCFGEPIPWVDPSPRNYSTCGGSSG